MAFLRESLIHTNAVVMIGTEFHVLKNHVTS